MCGTNFIGIIGKNISSTIDTLAMINLPGHDELCFHMDHGL